MQRSLQYRPYVRKNTLHGSITSGINGQYHCTSNASHALEMHLELVLPPQMLRSDTLT